MAESSIPVDLFNPGQVFACLGLLELADQFLGNAQAAFDCRIESDTRFRLKTKGTTCPVDFTLRFLRNASVKSRVPFNLSNGEWRKTWGEEPRIIDPNREDFPFPAPKSPATVPATLSCRDKRFELIYWGDDHSSSGRDNVKFWAGAGGYPGAALARDALALIRSMSGDIASDPLNASARQSSSFRFDWRRDYIPLDVGFSLNTHSKDRFVTVGYPIVEMLAAVGLTYARPKRINNLCYHYSVISTDDESLGLDPIFHRAALGTDKLPFTQRTFQMNLGWPGKENQARCITTVEELTS